MQNYALRVNTIQNNIAVGVLGASGYSGRELCSLIIGHPRFSLAFATANSQRGKTMLVRAQGAMHDVGLVAPEDVDLSKAQLVFCALPHGASAEWAARAYAAGCRVVDLSSDLRPGFGGTGRGAPDGLPADAPYGLPELFREKIRGARVVANPGCYATSVLVALAPLAKAGLIADGATVSISSASGASGAGAAPKPELLFAEITENFRAYAVGNSHRHLHEMRSVMNTIGGNCDLLFTPHLLPIDRGILSTIAVPLATSDVDALSIYRDAYNGEEFVEMVSELPSTGDVRGRNVVSIAVRVPEGIRAPTLLVFSAIDNLVKGAAGQAVQNANLMLGIDEGLGLHS